MLKVKEGFVLRKIGNETIAVPVGRRTSEVHGVIALTESGALLWRELVKGAKKENLADILLEAYEIDRATAQADVDSFLNGLFEQGVIVDE